MAEPLKTVAKYVTAKDARRARYRLQQAGILCQVEAEPPAEHAWHELGLTRGFALRVEELRVAEAIKILRQMEAPASAPPKASGDRAVEPWMCAGCQTPVPPSEPVCPQCGGSREESERLRAIAGEQADRAGQKALPWFFGFLLLFPPALVVYLLYKLISQAGRAPLEEEDSHQQEELPPPNGKP